MVLMQETGTVKAVVHPILQSGGFASSVAVPSEPLLHCLLKCYTHEQDVLMGKRCCVSLTQPTNGRSMSTFVVASVSAGFVIYAQTSSQLC